ncbi:hypothetical protein EDD21DRAFT_351863 [Dissophora ornata]|nr:hypothetical protein EDD21DRAFT_351863 [Dissophora ornata]
MWVPAPGFSMHPQMPSNGKPYQEHGFLHPSQQDQEYIGGPRRSGDPELRVLAERGQDGSFVNHRRENNKRNHRNGTGTRQYRQHEDYAQMNPQGNFPREAGFNNRGQHVTRTDRSSDSKSDLSSPGNPGQVKGGKKSRKHPQKNKVQKYQQYEKSSSSDQEGHIGKQSANRDNSTARLDSELNGADSQETDAQEQSQVNSLSGKMSKLTTADRSDAGSGRKRRNTDQSPKPSQISLVLETDSFPPLPSNSAAHSRGDSTVAALQSTPPVQRSPAWVNRSVRALAGETANPEIEQVGALNPSLQGQISISPEKPKVVCADLPTARGSSNNPEHQLRKPLPVNDASANLTPPVVNNPEQRRVPVSGMVASVGEENQVKSAATEGLTGKPDSGNGNGDSTVATKTPGGFSYASVLRVQQQQQRETHAEAAALGMAKGQATMEY